MYNYNEQKKYIFTEDGQVDFLAVRDHVSRTLKLSGAITGGQAITVIMGDSWNQMACFDRLVEIGELREIEQDSSIAWQNRVFVKRS